MKKSHLFSGIPLLALLLTGCNLLPLPSNPTGTSTSESSSIQPTSLTTLNPQPTSTWTSDETSDSSDPTTNPTTITTAPTTGPTSTTTGPTPTTSSSTSGTSTGPTTSSSSTSSLPPGPYVPDIPEGYYATCEGLEGEALANKIYDINPVKDDSYDWSRYEEADEALDDSSCILSLYTRHNIPKSNHCGSYAWDKWNREHIWTQTAWPESDEDNHNIFACEGQINGYRGNKIFAEGGTRVTVFNHVTDCYQTNSTFEPCDDAKGEVARSVMYGAVMYKRDLTSEIESIELALKWHLEHPISQREIRRNNVVFKNQGNRNPFTDNPDYACRIWGSTNSSTKSLCGIK